MNTRMITLVIITLLVGALIGYFIRPSELDLTKDQKTYLEAFEKVTAPDLDAFTIDSLQSASKDISRNSGAFISPAEAAEKLDRYISNKRLRRAGIYFRKKDVYGYFLGLNMIDSLLKEIKVYNESGPDVSIIGVRTYMARKYTGDGKYNDIFMIPVLDGGCNLYSVEDLIDEECHPESSLVVDGPPILNTSVPCPNKCN